MLVGGTRLPVFLFLRRLVCVHRSVTSSAVCVCVDIAFRPEVHWGDSSFCFTQAPPLLSPAGISVSALYLSALQHSEVGNMTVLAVFDLSISDMYV